MPENKEKQTDKQVTVFTKPGCGKCMFTKSMLEDLNVPYEEINVHEDEEALKHVKEGLGYNSLPVVEFGGTHFNGFKPEQLKDISESL